MQKIRQVGKLKLLTASSSYNFQYNYQSQQPQIPAQLFQILDNAKWNLSDGKFNISNINTIFPYIVQLSCLHLLLNHNNRITIIQQISHIKFTQLRQLSLSGNNIENIEILSYIDMPNLQNLLLNQNNITSIKSFAHISTNCQNIQWISLQNNCIMEFQNITTYIFGVKETFRYLEMNYFNDNRRINWVKLSFKMCNWAVKLPQEFMILSQDFVYQSYSSLSKKKQKQLKSNKNNNKH